MPQQSFGNNIVMYSAKNSEINFTKYYTEEDAKSILFLDFG